MSFFSFVTFQEMKIEIRSFKSKILWSSFERKFRKDKLHFSKKNTSQKPRSFREDFKDYSSVSFCINLEFFMWKWVFSADFHRLEYFQDFGDGKLLVGQSNEISEIWKNALEEDPEHPSLPQDDWWLLIKLCFFPFIAFRPKVANYCLVYYLQRWSFLLWFFDKNNKLVFNFKVTNSFILDFHEVGISYFPVKLEIV